MKSGEKCQAMFKRALESIPCGVNSNFRYWGDEETLILKRAKGAYLWDQDAAFALGVFEEALKEVIG